MSNCLSQFLAAAANDEPTVVTVSVSATLTQPDLLGVWGLGPLHRDQGVSSPSPFTGSLPYNSSQSSFLGTISGDIVFFAGVWFGRSAVSTLSYLIALDIRVDKVSMTVLSVDGESQAPAGELTFTPVSISAAHPLPNYEVPGLSCQFSSPNGSVFTVALYRTWKFLGKPPQS